MSREKYFGVGPDKFRQECQQVTDGRAFIDDFDKRPSLDQEEWMICCRSAGRAATLLMVETDTNMVAETEIELSALDLLNISQYGNHPGEFPDYEHIGRLIA